MAFKGNNSTRAASHIGNGAKIGFNWICIRNTESSFGRIGLKAEAEHTKQEESLKYRYIQEHHRAIYLTER